MILLPAIDLMNGCCVRLKQGRADQQTVYSKDPIAQAKAFREQGAKYLHVVDLDGAFAGAPRHATIIADIVRESGLSVEVGGGIRTEVALNAVLAAGVARAIIGTGALEQTKQLARWVTQYGAHIAVGIDARDGFVQTRGWVETSSVRAIDLAKRVADCGVQTIIYTDTATDGMLRGTNLPAMKQLAEAVPHVHIIASGGISLPEHIQALHSLKCPNIWGAIVGKALYEGVAALPDFLSVAQDEA